MTHQFQWALVYRIRTVGARHTVNVKELVQTQRPVLEIFPALGMETEAMVMMLQEKARLEHLDVLHVSQPDGVLGPLAFPETFDRLERQQPASVHDKIPCLHVVGPLQVQNALGYGLVFSLSVMVTKQSVGLQVGVTHDGHSRHFLPCSDPCLHYANFVTHAQRLFAPIHEVQEEAIGAELDILDPFVVYSLLWLTAFNQIIRCGVAAESIVIECEV
mmetsp:Transcript_106369/g.200286  ORF Transcript_106369/g.200286 Transcript_106369/m.200286 type:complete len:217 (+) Transcript_106369:1389-2039(+)